MEALEAKILLKNLLKRIRPRVDGGFLLSGEITEDEISALQHSLSLLESGSGINIPATEDKPLKSFGQPPFKPVPRFVPALEAEGDGGSEIIDKAPAAILDRSPLVEIDDSVLMLPNPPADRRLCIDFGTAMSKVALVRDESDTRGYEEIEVLQLGVPGDQEEVSLTMLVSSVFIDLQGLLWFGDMAVRRSKLEEGRKRLDNVKHYLSVEGDGLSSTVSDIFNPTGIEITYEDMILAYLMFLTWTVNHCVKTSGEPRNLIRRYALPCFDPKKAREMAVCLGDMLGIAQVMADTFFKTLQDGIPLSSFMDVAGKVRAQRHKFPFIGEPITEPLGVAGSIMSWKSDVNALVLVVDVGAGTSDFSLYRIHFKEETGKKFAFEIKGSSEGITEAGNYLDTLLRGLILKKANVSYEDPIYKNIVGNLELDLRDYKERMFEDGEVTVRLFNDALVPVTLDEFLQLEQVVKFGESLISCRDRILNRVDSSVVDAAPFGTLAIALTGGGASLPMVKALAQGKVNTHGKELKLTQISAFPQWLSEEYPDLESDFPRIAVSLGGARKRVIDRDGIASITAGGDSSTRVLEGYYTKG